MAISFVFSNQNAAGTTTTAGTAAVTLSLPTGTAVGDRVFILDVGSAASDTAPTGWTLLGTKDLAVGASLGAAASSAGQRFMTVYYRDYDGVWTMPTLNLVSATQNSHAAFSLTLRKTAGATWNTPTISSLGEDLSNDATFSATTPSFTTHSGGFLMAMSVININRTMSAETLTQSGATFGTLTERNDGGTATGNDVAGEINTCTVTTGATAAVTLTGTLSSTGAQGGVVAVEQTETAPVNPPGAFLGFF